MTICMENRGNNGAPGKHWLTLCLLVSVLVTISGCVMIEQPESPLSPSGDPTSAPLPVDTDLRLVTNRWRMVEVTYQGEAVPLETVQPISVMFTWIGGLSAVSPACGGAASDIYFESKHRYRLGGGGTSANDCSGDNPFALALLALRATHEYAFHNEQLVLSGEDARIVLEVEEAWPLFPSTEPTLVRNFWRWIAVTEQGEPVAFEALEPIFTYFVQTGAIYIIAANCHYGVYKVTAAGERGYSLTREAYSETCAENGDTTPQYEQAMALLEATNAYELRDDQLFLTGDEVEIVLEIDNSPLRRMP